MHIVIPTQGMNQSLPQPQKVALLGKCCSLNQHMKMPKDLMAYTVYNQRSVVRFRGHHLALPSYEEITICHAQASSIPLLSFVTGQQRVCAPEQTRHCLLDGVSAFHAMRLFSYDGTAAGKQQLFYNFHKNVTQALGR